MSRELVRQWLEPIGPWTVQYNDFDNLHFFYRIGQLTF